VNRQISRLALASLVLLTSLIVVTTYWQTWASGGLAARQDNSIQTVVNFEIKRGKIYAADGRTVLATNIARKSNGKTFYYRTYPKHGAAAQVLGYSTLSRSRAGLEQAENVYLTGSNKNAGTFLGSLGLNPKGKTVVGSNVVTTIDLPAQRLAEKLLAGKCGAAVALNPQTGSVYLMASTPGYNSNLIEQPGGYAKIQGAASPCPPEAASPLLNRATQGLYPPGSTFKTITAAAALDDGVFTSTSPFDDPGYCTEYGKRVYNANDQNGPEAYGHVDLAQAYQHSINAVFCMIGEKLGAGKILAEAKKFGFYSPPPLETPADSRSASGLYNCGGKLGLCKLYDPKSPDTEVDPGRLAFGQERMLVTPLQMAMVASAVADGGTLMRPHVVKAILSPTGSVVSRTQPETLSHPITPTTASDLNTMMVSVVTGGTGTMAQIPGVVVAGKTGTAETGKPKVYDAWFIFFAPADHPVVAGAVVVESQLNGFGGAVAAPIAKSIMQAILPKASKAKP
jgi:peptidoglycan glycosyltransferase